MKVISLARTPERLAKFSAINPHISTEVIQAIDGNNVGYLEILPPQLPFTPGAVGCLMSHLMFWEQVTDAPQTVFEDDAVIHHQFVEASNAILENLPSDWHLCLWGWNFDAPMLFDATRSGMQCMIILDQDAIRKSPTPFQSGSISTSAFPLTRFHGTVSYAISPEGARALRSMCIPIPVDDIDYFGQTFPNNGIDRTINVAIAKGLRAFVCFPPLVATPNEPGESTVRL